MSGGAAGGRVGEHRVRRQRAGVGCFGQVRVRVVAPEDRSSSQPGSDREFVDAAVAGAWDGLGAGDRVELAFDGGWVVVPVS